MRLFSFRNFTLIMLSANALPAIISAFTANSWAWSNGGYSSDPSNPDYGTHDWIAQHALNWLPPQEKQYILSNLATYLYGTELPDNNQTPDGIGDTTKHHIYYNSTEALTDDAAAVRASTEYSNTLNFLKVGDYTKAVKNAGIMSHYIADIAVFGHVMGSSTDWGTETHHRDYETYVNDRTPSYSSEFNTYLSFDGSLNTVSAYDAAKNLAYDTTFDVDGDLTCVWMDQNYDWNNPTFKNRAGESLNLAANYLTDVLHTLYQESVVSDETPPVTTDNYDGLWHTTDFTITLTATDTLSGVRETHYKINSGPTQTVQTNGQPLMTTEAANNTLEYWSTDNNENQENHHTLTDIQLDKTAPTGSIKINNNEAYTAKLTVTLNLSATDTISRISQMRFRNDDISWTAWESYSVTKTWTLTANDGTKDVYVQFKDNAGLISPTCSDSITLDTMPPSVTITYPSEGSEIRSSTIAVTWVSSDQTSGISNFETRLDSEPWTNTGANTAQTLTTLPDGTHRIDVKATDRAGNTKQVTVSFTVNTTSPALGSGHILEAVLTATIAIAALFTAIYLIRARRKTKDTS